MPRFLQVDGMHGRLAILSTYTETPVQPRLSSHGGRDNTGLSSYSRSHVPKDKMTGFCWTYEQLCKAVPKLTAHSSSPTCAADLNPIIKGLLTSCPNSSICDIGGHSVLLSFPHDIVAKVSLKANGEHVRNEQSIFDLLDQTPCPHIVQTFLRCPDIIFMERLNDGNLHDRMSTVNTPHQTLQWMQQLSDAAAWIESHGRVHGDINPRNILFKKDQLKLVDFDHSVKIKDPLDVGYEPYVRGCKRGEEGGNFGIAGPRTEQFALGSIFWYMTRGTELYHDLKGREKVNRLIDRQFPATKPQDPIDCIISECWLGRFGSVAEVSKSLHEIETFDTSEDVLGEGYWARKEECERYYRLLRTL